jgi:hypothetical protein
MLVLETTDAVLQSGIHQLWLDNPVHPKEAGYQALLEGIMKAVPVQRQKSISSAGAETQHLPNMPTRVAENKAAWLLATSTTGEAVLPSTGGDWPLTQGGSIRAIPPKGTLSLEKALLKLHVYTFPLKPYVCVQYL